MCSLHEISVLLKAAKLHVVIAATGWLCWPNGAQVLDTDFPESGGKGPPAKEHAANTHPQDTESIEAVKLQLMTYPVDNLTREIFLVPIPRNNEDIPFSIRLRFGYNLRVFGGKKDVSLLEAPVLR